MNNEKQYLLNKLLDRIDFFTNTVNSKAAFIISFNTFILGTVILKYRQIINVFKYQKLKAVISFLLIIIILGICESMFWVFKAVNPFMDSGNRPSSYHSLLFFGSISKMEFDDYCEKVNNLDEDNLTEDLQNQTHILSVALTNKFNYLSKSMFWILWFILGPLILLAVLKIIEWFFI